MVINLTVPIHSTRPMGHAQSVQFLIENQLKQLSESGKKGNVNSDWGNFCAMIGNANVYEVGAIRAKV